VLVANGPRETGEIGEEMRVTAAETAGVDWTETSSEARCVMGRRFEAPSPHTSVSEILTKGVDSSFPFIMAWERP
jgi:hypothetical protein